MTRLLQGRSQLKGVAVLRSSLTTAEQNPHNPRQEYCKLQGTSIVLTPSRPDEIHRPTRQKRNNERPAQPSRRKCAQRAGLRLTLSVTMMSADRREASAHPRAATVDQSSQPRAFPSPQAHMRNLAHCRHSRTAVVRRRKRTRQKRLTCAD